MNRYLHIHPEVREALAAGRPVVALESTIISHGMPWPQNRDTALAVEEAVRANGAVPATIAILDGHCMVGLEAHAIERLGRDADVWKVSLRDMPYVIASKVPGATTVAATMRIAAMAGIRVFATGGIGGVHRGASDTFDISADLTEMACTDVAIISAGVKSILDIGATLEYLETLGVPVVTIGQDEFPAFYSRRSGFSSPLRIDTPQAVAAMLHAKWDLHLSGSVLIANPVPDVHEVPRERMEAHIQQALAEADARGVKGKAVTPYLLQRVAELTGGESLEANVALIKSNAAMAARIAVAYHG